MISKLNIILFLLLILACDIYSEDWDCPDDGVPWILNYFNPYDYGNYQLGPLDELCGANYNWRYSGTTSIQIKIDWSSYHEKAEYKKLSSDEKKNFLYIGIIEWITGTMEPWVGVKEFAFIEKTVCYKYNYCYFSVNQTVEFGCGSNYWTTIEIDHYKQQYNGDDYWTNFEQSECGYKCCELVISVEYINNHPIIIGSSISEYPESSCHQLSNEVNCLDQSPIECSGTCSVNDFIRE
jgi:hypothetical protein